MFKSKHQKLILQCYPAGKAIDKKPNPSELSYLLYYASTRRVKLEKVVTFLDRKTKHDANHNRAGNLQVTLAIISALIEKCSDNLNSFAVLVCSILNSIISSKDLALCKNAINTYGVLCTHLDGGLFTGDPEFVGLFTSVTKLLIGLGSSSVNAKGPNSMEWRMTSLMCCNHLSNCIGFNVLSGSVFLHMAVPLLVSTISQNSSQSSLLTRLNSNVNVEFGDGTGHRLSKVGTSKTMHITPEQLQENFENDNVSLSDLTEEAFSALKAIFSTTSTLQIAEATRIVVHTNYEMEVEQLWGTTFLEMCTIWVPVQLRFATISTLLVKLKSISKTSTAYTTQYDYQKLYANYILGLISSDVNMIGLSISDIMQQLLSLQSGLFLVQSVYLSDDDLQELSAIYSRCIQGLSTHIYYHDQICDSIDELLTKIEDVLQLTFKETNVEPSKIYEFLVSLLGNISAIFKNLHNNTSSITRTTVHLDHWDISLPLLNPETDHEGAASNLSPSELVSLKLKYLTVFNEYLNTELYQVSPSSSTDEIREISSNSEQDYMEPDAFQYISIHNNVISHFLVHTDKTLSRHKIDPDVARELVVLLRSLSKILGINFLVNFVPFFFHWTTHSFTGAQSDSELTKQTIAYVTLYTALLGLEGRYKLENGFIASSEFLKKVQSDISYMHSSGTWVSGLNQDLDDLPKSSLQSKLEQEADKKSLQEFANSNEFLAIWLQPSRPLVLNINDAIDPDRTDTSRITSNYLTIVRSTDGSTHDSTHGDGARSPLSEMSDGGSFLRPNGMNLGLGSATDIHSIQSGLLKTYNGTLTDSKAAYVSPRITDLKDAMSLNGTVKRANSVTVTINGNGKPHVPSALGANVHQDITSILDDLDRVV